MSQLVVSFAMLVHTGQLLLLPGATKQVRQAAHANSALRATLSQEPALTGPVRRHILCHRPSIFSLKIAPGGTLSSANKWATCLTRFIPLPKLKDMALRTDPAGGEPFGDFEARSREADQGRSGGRPDRGRPVQDVR